MATQDEKDQSDMKRKRDQMDDEKGDGPTLPLEMIDLVFEWMLWLNVDMDSRFVLLPLQFVCREWRDAALARIRHHDARLNRP